MDRKKLIERYWKAVAKQNLEELRCFFDENAVIRWHNTNEQFTKEEFIIANCEYPGSWIGEIERIEMLGNLVITAVKICEKEKKQFFHVTSFILFKDDKIIKIDEYWGDDGEAPTWRKDKKIGIPIK